MTRLGVAGVGLLCLAGIASAEPTLTKLNDNAAMGAEGWGVPRLNNAGQIIMTQRNSSGYGGHPWFYDGSTWTSVPNTANAYVVYGRWQLNDMGTFVYVTEASFSLTWPPAPATSP